MEETLLVVGKRPELLTSSVLEESEVEAGSVPSSAFFPHWNDLVSMVEAQNEGAAPKLVGVGAGTAGSAAGVGVEREEAEDEEEEVPEDPNEPSEPKPPDPKLPVPKLPVPKPPDPKLPVPKEPDPNDPVDPNEEAAPKEPKPGLLWSPEVEGMEAKAEEKDFEVDLGSAASFCQPKEMVWVFAGEEEAPVVVLAEVSEAPLLPVSFLASVSPLSFFFSSSSFLLVLSSDSVFGSSLFSSLDEEDPPLVWEI